MNKKMESKVWGTTKPLVITPLFELHRLKIKPWHRCSLHEHRFKHNAFYVIEGAVFIDWMARPATQIATTLARLGAGEVLTVAPNIPHQFRTGPDSCVMLEMYYTEPLSEDIIRRNIGGPVDHD